MLTSSGAAGANASTRPLKPTDAWPGTTVPAGARTVKYGPARPWVMGLELVTADGEVGWLRRGQASDPPTLAALARSRAAEYLARQVDGAACVVIGDTPADVACGLAIGARTIAVCTGNFTEDALRASGAHVVLRDLGDTGAVLEAILRG